MTDKLKDGVVAVPQPDKAAIRYSPSRDFYMKITPIEHRYEDGRIGGWNYLSIEVFRKDHTLIGTTGRNYCNLGPMCFIEQPTEEMLERYDNYGSPEQNNDRAWMEDMRKIAEYEGPPYLLLSENYHGGYGVMDLMTGEKHIFNPERKEGVYNAFWCWAHVHSVVTRADGKMELDVEGCYWACGYDRHVYDFSEPTKPPYTLLKEWECDSDDD